VQRLNQEGKLVARDIRFEENKVTFMPESLARLKEVARLMKENASLRFEIQYYPDEEGEEKIKLWQSRAEAVRNALSLLGVRSTRLVAKSYGSSKPASGDNSPEDKANNRRIEFVRI
jgi:OOP family OmpA-OmpF porin